MAKFTVCRWEINGYHDSYFYEGYYDSETKFFSQAEVGATAYAGGGTSTTTPTIDTAPTEVRAEYRRIAVQRAAELIYGAAESEHAEPNAVQIGDELTTVRATRRRDGTTIPEGVSGRVFWSGSYGRFYRNGYNRPNRSNTGVGLELIDGRRVFVGLSACRRAGVCESLESIRRRINTTSFSCKGLFSCKAWLSEEFR